MIKKTSQGYKVTSESGKNLSSNDLTKAEAHKRLGQIEYFKSHKDILMKKEQKDRYDAIAAQAKKEAQERRDGGPGSGPQGGIGQRMARAKLQASKAARKSASREARGKANAFGEGRSLMQEMKK